MLDYYKILGIPRSADHATIRSAYKKLALKYHPDRNPDNAAAEEYFKILNEGKQLLCDPAKRARYDLLLDYAYGLTRQTTYTYREPYSYTHHNVYGYQNHSVTSTGYRVDKDYFKVQLLTLLLVAIISMLSIGIFKTSEYIQKRKAENIRIENDKTLAQAHDLYNSGDYRTALNMIIHLIRDNPVEPKFYDHKQTMVTALNDRTIVLYQKANYQQAMENLQILQEYQEPMQLSTWGMIADCHYHLGNYKKAIHALEYIRIRDKYNIGLLMQIGDIYHYKLGFTSKALEYYTEAKLLFKEIQSDSYGSAFELIMPAEKVPQIYYDMFMGRAALNMEYGDFEEAITDCNWASHLRPDSARAYHLRGICKVKTGKMESACNDWKKALQLGFEASNPLTAKYCGD